MSVVVRTRWRNEAEKGMKGMETGDGRKGRVS